MSGLSALTATIKDRISLQIQTNAKPKTMTDPIIEEEKKRITLHFRSRIKRVSNFYQKKISANSDNFEKAAKKIAKEHETVVNLLVKNYDKQLAKTEIQRASFASLRKKIVFEVCEYFGYEVEVIKQSNRRQERGKSDCIQLIYYFLYSHRMGTLKEIGREVNRKGSSVCMGVASVDNFIKTDKTFRQHFTNLKRIIDDLIEENSK